MGSHGQFPTTRWSLILATRQQPTTLARDALAHLCAAYWYPLYAYARRRCARTEDAQDLTQGFFACILEKDYVKTSTANEADSEHSCWRLSDTLLRTSAIASLR